jgi:hypothetical protein
LELDSTFVIVEATAAASAQLSVISVDIIKSGLLDLFIC